MKVLIIKKNVGCCTNLVKIIMNFDGNDLYHVIGLGKLNGSCVGFNGNRS